MNDTKQCGKNGQIAQRVVVKQNEFGVSFCFCQSMVNLPGMGNHETFPLKGALGMVKGDDVNTLGTINQSLHNGLIVLPFQHFQG